MAFFLPFWCFHWRNKTQQNYPIHLCVKPIFIEENIYAAKYLLLLLFVLGRKRNFPMVTGRNLKIIYAVYS